MNECELYQELISRLVDGELSRDEYKAVKAHIESCDECSAMFAVFASLSDIIGSEDEPLPDGLHEEIMAGVRRQAMADRNRHRLSKPLRNTLAAAACAALVLFASRGLSPAEKAEQAVLTKDQAAAMEVAAAPEAAAVAESPAVESSAPAAAPAAVETEPVETAAPSPAPTEDVYLAANESRKTDSGNNEDKISIRDAKPAASPAPVEIVVNTPAPAAVSEAPEPSINVSPEAVSEEPVEETVEAETSAEPKASPTEENRTEAAESPVPEYEGTEKTAAVEVSPAAGDIQPEETDSPSLSQRFFSMFSLRPSAHGNAVTEDEIAEEEADAAPTEAAPAAEAEELEEEDAQEQSDGEDENRKSVRLQRGEKLRELEKLMQGDEAELPGEKADKSFRFVMAEPDKEHEDYALLVDVYGEEIYCTVVCGEDEPVTCLTGCTAEELVKFIDSLSAEEKAELGDRVEESPAPTKAPEESPEAAAAQ